MFEKLFKRKNQSASNDAKESEAASDAAVAAEETTSEGKPSLIKVHDVYGRELQITREEWRAKVLGPNLEKASGKPDALYQLCNSALNDGFVEDIDHASEELIALEPDAERSYALRSIVLFRTHRVDEAERVLQQGIQRTGRSATLLANLAVLRVSRGDSSEGEALMWEALEIDPNIDQGLRWWANTFHQRGGMDAYREALERVAALPGSWRAPLWLAREKLKEGDVDGAVAMFEAILHRPDCPGEALLTISGDLGNKGEIARIPQLIAPVFDPTKHDPRVGFNLLQAYLQLKQRKAGEALLQQLYALQMAPFKQHLDKMAAAFAAIPDEMDLKESAFPDVPEIELMAFDQPIWTYGLQTPSWLISAKPREVERVVCFAFSRRVDADEHGGTQKEDEGGRMTRALPLYLAESVLCWTTVASRTLIPVVKGGGPAVFGAGDDEDLCRKLADQGTYLVTGELDDRGGRWKFAMRLWRTADATLIAEEHAESEDQDATQAVLALEQALLRHLSLPAAQPWLSFYTRPSTEAMYPYLVELGQSLMLSLFANEVMTSNVMWGERSVLEWPLDIALRWADAQVPVIMFVSGLSKAKTYRTTLLPEFRERALQLMKDVRRRGGVAAKLEPLVWSLYGMQDSLTQFAQSLGTEESEAYRQWVAKIATTSSEGCA
jgi:tetratricopeptide (TPR) repeat protein